MHVLSYAYAHTNMNMYTHMNTMHIYTKNNTKEKKIKKRKAQVLEESTEVQIIIHNICAF